MLLNILSYNTKSSKALNLTSKKIQEKPCTFFKDFKRKPIGANTQAQPCHKKILLCKNKEGSTYIKNAVVILQWPPIP